MPKPKGKKKMSGRPREEKELRQTVGASIRAASHRQLFIWVAKAKKKDGGSHVGRVLDSLIEFGRVKRFNP